MTKTLESILNEFSIESRTTVYGGCHVHKLVTITVLKSFNTLEEAKKYFLKKLDGHEYKIIEAFQGDSIALEVSYWNNRNKQPENFSIEF